MKKRLLSFMLVLSMIVSVISSMPITASAAQEKTSSAKYVHDFVMNYMGMNCAAACAVCANIEEESGFNPKATGDSGTSYGICQWRNNNFTRLKTYCSNNGYDYTTLEAQMNFLNWDLADQGKWLLNYLKTTENTADGAYNAAYYFCTTYEKPSDAESKGIERGKLARDTYWTYYSNSSSSIVTPPTTAPSTTVSVASGSCSDNIKWYFDGNDTLIIKGTGEIDDFMNDQGLSTNRGWESYTNQIKKVYISEGITYIGAWTFMAKDSVEEIYVLEPTCMIASGANYPDCKIYAYRSDEYNSLCQYASASYTKSTYIEINSSNAPKLPVINNVEPKAVSFDISPKSGNGNIILGRDENGNGIYDPKTGDKFTFTIVTSSNVNEISICGDKSDETKWHEISYQYLKDNYELKDVDNGDGTKTWTAKIYLNEPGYRTFMVRVNGQDTDIKASVNVNAQNILADDETTTPPTQGGGFTDDENNTDENNNNNNGSFSDTPQQGQEHTNPDGTWGDQPKEPEQPEEKEELCKIYFVKTLSSGNKAKTPFGFVAEISTDIDYKELYFETETGYPIPASAFQNISTKVIDKNTVKVTFDLTISDAGTGSRTLTLYGKNISGKKSNGESVTFNVTPDVINKLATPVVAINGENRDCKVDKDTKSVEISWNKIPNATEYNVWLWHYNSAEPIATLKNVTSYKIDFNTYGINEYKSYAIAIEAVSDKVEYENSAYGGRNINLTARLNLIGLDNGNTLSAAASVTGACADITVDTDATNNQITAISNANWLSVEVVGNVVKGTIKTENRHDERYAKVTVSVPGATKTYTVIHKSGVVEQSYKQGFSVNSNTVVSIGKLSTKEKEERVFPNGIRFKDKATADSNMVTVTVPVWKIDKNNQKYESTIKLTVNKALAEDVKNIFNEIFNDSSKFPFNSNYGAYNWRNSASGSRSEHSYGTCIDINTDANYMIRNNGTIVAGSFWKPGESPYSIPADSIVVKTFEKYGWTWGGNWKNSKDYMHFSYLGG